MAALLLMFISLGVSGTAFADQGNGKATGQGNGPTAASTQSSSQPSSQSQSSTKQQPSAKPTKSASSGSSKSGSHATSGTAGTSGDVSSPQPNSGADDNTGGANGQCPGGAYCSTRDGSPSLNGNGGGKATGKPCAGCVGKADNKNPQGQRPNGSDHNNGYECDGNNGIGKSNPAHTGCTGSSTPPGTCVPTSTQDANCNEVPPCIGTAEVPCAPSTGCVPTETVPCAPVTGCVPTETVPCAPSTGCVPTETVPCAPVTGCVATESVPCGPATECVPAETVPCVPTTDCVPEMPCTPSGPTTPPKGVELNRPPAVLGTEAMRSPGAVAAAAAAAQPTQGTLPNTGASSLLTLLTGTGAALLVAGGATLALRRRSEQV